MRRDAAFNFRFGGGEGLAQLGERVSAGKRCEKKSIRLERSPDLNQRAGQIIDELQSERGHHKIERRVLERQRLLVGDNGKIWALGEGTGRNDVADLAACSEHTPYGVD